MLMNERSGENAALKGDGELRVEVISFVVSRGVLVSVILFKRVGLSSLFAVAL